MLHPPPPHPNVSPSLNIPLSFCFVSIQPNLNVIHRHYSVLAIANNSRALNFGTACLPLPPSLQSEEAGGGGGGGGKKGGGGGMYCRVPPPNQSVLSFFVTSSRETVEGEKNRQACLLRLETLFSCFLPLLLLASTKRLERKTNDLFCFIFNTRAPLHYTHFVTSLFHSTRLCVVCVLCVRVPDESKQKKSRKKKKGRRKRF